VSFGMDIPAISCPCNANVESANHVFFECDIATDMWKLVFTDGVIFLFFKLLLGILSMIGSSLGMLLKRKNAQVLCYMMKPRNHRNLYGFIAVQIERWQFLFTR
ncbi:hypothetical protein Tco_1249706, partial [Tanacetum coccineum]